MFIRKLLWLCLFVAFFCPNAQAQTGFFSRPNCATISAPVANQTLCLQTTTTGGRTAGGFYVWNGSAWGPPTNLGTGSGSVTSFSAGNLSPLFTSSVANPTTTPALTFSLSNAAANTVFGNATGSGASPSYGQIVTGQITNSAVTLGKIANAAANSKLLGSGAAGSGSPYSEITLGTNLSMSGTTLNATGGGGSGCTTSGSNLLYGDGAGGCANVSGATSDGTAATFASGDLKATSPKITTSIADANGNAAIGLGATASAVNAITVTNAATAGAPLIRSSGSDSNIDLNIAPKGTGAICAGTDCSSATGNVSLGAIALNGDFGTTGQVPTSSGGGAMTWTTPGGGALTLIQKQTVTSTQTTITFSGLDGNTDEVYLLHFRIIGAGSAATCALRPNGATTNLTIARVYNGGSDTGSAEWVMTSNVQTSDTAWGDITIFAKDNPNSVATKRTMVGQVGQTTGGGSSAALIVNEAGIWNETSTNITSFDITCGTSNIGSGSTFALYKYAQS